MSITDTGTAKCQVDFCENVCETVGKQIVLSDVKGERTMVTCSECEIRK